MSSPFLLQRLKERKLVQWAVAYLAGAFVVFQLLDALSEPLGLSTTVRRAILAMVGIGFFITLVLAWYHGEKGRQRVSGPELLMVAALLVMAGVAMSMLPGGEEGERPDQALEIARINDDRPSIAVLPFDDMSPERDQQHIGDGIAEEILSALTRIPGLKVAGRTASFSFRGREGTIREIGEELGVSTVLEGSVQTEGNRKRITAQLINPEDGFHLWSERFDRELESVSALEDDVARRVVGSLREELLGELTGPLVTEATPDFRAYSLYLEGRAYANRQTEEDLRRTAELLSEAIEEDSAFASDYSGLADAHLGLGLNDRR